MTKIYFLTLALHAGLLLTAQIPTTGLKAYWPFDGNANDMSGNNNNGTVFNATLATDRFGNTNRCYAFNGTSSHIDVLHSATVDMASGQDFSVSFWVKTNAGATASTPIYKGVYGVWSGYMFMAKNNNSGYCTTSGNMTFYVAASSQGDACANTGICNDAANWYFVTGNYKASTNQSFIYVNAVLQSDVGGKASGSSTSNTNKLIFGATNNSSSYLNYFNGYLDDIRLYGKLLTQAEITALYNEANPVIGVKELTAVFDELSIAPNPVNGDNVNLSFSSKIDGKAEVRVIDNLGKVVAEYTKEITQGKNDLDMNLPELAAGFYNVSISTGTAGSQTIKFVKN